MDSTTSDGPNNWRSHSNDWVSSNQAARQNKTAGEQDTTHSLGLLVGTNAARAVLGLPLTSANTTGSGPAAPDSVYAGQLQEAGNYCAGGRRRSRTTCTHYDRHRSSVGQLLGGRIETYHGANLLRTSPILQRLDDVRDASLDSSSLSERLKASSQVGERSRKPKQQGGGKREKIYEYSRKARRAMLQAVGKIKNIHLRRALELGLTIPADCPFTAREAKARLKKLFVRLQQLWPEAAAIWVMEATRKGIPHFHVLLLGASWLAHEWLADAWSMACGCISDAHRKAGSHVGRLRGIKAATYLAKHSKYKLADQNPGRMWGTIGDVRSYEAIPTTHELSPREYLDLKRILQQSRLSQARAKKGLDTRRHAISKARRRPDEATRSNWYLCNADQIMRSVTGAPLTFLKESTPQYKDVVVGGRKKRVRIPTYVQYEPHQARSFAEWDKSIQHLISPSSAPSVKARTNANPSTCLHHAKHQNTMAYSTQRRQWSISNGSTPTKTPKTTSQGPYPLREIYGQNARVNGGQIASQ